MSWYQPNKEAAESKGPGNVESGTYQFRIDSFELKTFKTGSSGVSMSLQVFCGGERNSVTVWDNLVSSEKAQWRIKQLADCVGFDFMNPPPPVTMIGKTGTAKFKKDPVSEYLKVDKFLPAEQPANNWSPPADTRSPAVGPGDLPF